MNQDVDNIIRLAGTAAEQQRRCIDAVSEMQAVCSRSFDRVSRAIDDALEVLDAINSRSDSPRLTL